MRTQLYRGILPASQQAMVATLLLPMILATASVAAAQIPTFEVAAVRRNVSNEPAGGSISRPSGGRFQASNVTLRTLIRTAYDVEDFQILGGVKWLDSDKFDVAAKASGNANWQETRIMLQDLLVKRFHLLLNRESRTMPVYLLVISKDGSKLSPPTDKTCEPPPFGACGGIRIVNRSVLSGINVSTAQIARVLKTFLGRPALDQTGLAGVFDFKMDFVLDLPRTGEPPKPDDAPAAAPVGPSIVTALQEQLGLKLLSQKAPVDMLVITGAQQPAPN